MDFSLFEDVIRWVNYVIDKLELLSGRQSTVQEVNCCKFFKMSTCFLGKNAGNRFL